MFYTERFCNKEIKPQYLYSVISLTCKYNDYGAQNVYRTQTFCIKKNSPQPL